jgi:FMN hydrolase / 5-amino-6-(5-phospho-D-ribitylamino)uracil phosphatase
MLLGILTNGNADISRDPILSNFSILSIGAAEIGAAKPNPIGFLSFLQRWQVSPHRILFIGDDYEKDIQGAKAVGMMTWYLIRQPSSSPSSTAELISEEQQQENYRRQYPDADFISKDLDVTNFQNQLFTHLMKSL